MWLHCVFIVQYQPKRGTREHLPNLSLKRWPSHLSFSFQMVKYIPDQNQQHVTYHFIVDPRYFIPGSDTRSPLRTTWSSTQSSDGKFLLLQPVCLKGLSTSSWHSIAYFQLSTFYCNCMSFSCCRLLPAKIKQSLRFYCSIIKEPLNITIEPDKNEILVHSEYI